MRKFLRKSIKVCALMVLVYTAHVLIEAFVITNVLAYFGVAIPVIV